MENNIELYQPSNGSEGSSFMTDFCDQCRYKPKCKIILYTMVYDIRDKKYPTECCYINDKPTCTKFKKPEKRKYKKVVDKLTGTLF